MGGWAGGNGVGGKPGVAKRWGEGGGRTAGKRQPGWGGGANRGEGEARGGGVRPGGQQRRLAMGGARVTRPRLWLREGPTEGIQPNIIKQIGRVISQLRAEGEMAIVLVEQYFEFAFDLADRFYVMGRGALSFEAAKSETTKDQVRAAFSIHG